MTTFLKSPPIRKIENRFISLVERTIKRSLKVRTLNFSRELPRNVKQQFGSKTYFVQLDSILSDIVVLATRHADEMAGVAAAAVNEPRTLTDEAVQASQDLASEVVESIVRILKDDAVYYESPAALASRIQDLWGGERYRALRFARTFTADVAVTTELNRYQEHGLEYVQFEAKIDDRTSDQCRTLHGTVMRTDSAETKRLRPPLHHNCRSDLIPVAITTEIPEDLKYENRDFRDHVSQDFRQKYQTVDRKRVDKTFKKIDTFNDKYRVDNFVLNDDIERRISKEKGLSLPVSKSPARNVPQENIEDIVRRHEDEIRHKSYENCFAFGPDGKILLNKSGSKDTIVITREEGVRLKGAIFTHNHPRSSSFSPADIQTSCGVGLKEIRIASSRYSYSMRLKDGSAFSEDLWSEKIEPTMNKYNFVVRNELEDQIIAGQVSIDDANILHWHEVWSRVVKDIPELEYSRT